MNLNLNIHELTVDDIAQWPLVPKVILAGLVILIVSAFGYYLVISSRLDSFFALKQEEKHLKTSFEIQQSKSVSRLLSPNTLQELEQQLGVLLKRIPEENEMPALLQDISKTGADTGLQFQLFAPQAEVVHDFYVELPIFMKLSGNYKQLATFCSRVAAMQRMVTLHDFTIQKSVLENVDAEANSTQHEDILEMGITAKIYWYRRK